MNLFWVNKTYKLLSFYYTRHFQPSDHTVDNFPSPIHLYTNSAPLPLTLRVQLIGRCISVPGQLFGTASANSRENLGLQN